MQRATLKRPVELPPAPGVLSRRLVRCGLEPAPEGSGLRVQRTDTGESWAIAVEHTVPATNRTAVGTAASNVSYLEHALAALNAARVTEALLWTDGPELPLFDGSAAAWWQALQEAGRREFQTPLRPVVLTEPVYVTCEGGVLLGLPAAQTTISYLLDYDHPQIGRQWAQWADGEDFGDSLAAARTFATAEQVLAQTGLAAIPPEAEAVTVVVYPDRLSAPLPWPNALARHKLVDLLGDLYLLGRPLQGAVVALRTGHGDNHAFVREVLRRVT